MHKIKKMKRKSTLAKYSESEVIMIKNSRRLFLLIFVISMVLLMSSQLQKHLNKMELLKERIELYKRWLKSC